MRWRPAQLLAVVVAAVLIALAAAAPAGAHAVLLETQPANGTVLETWPDRVLLRFNEPVDASLGALRVYDSDANRVDSGRTSRPDAQTVAIELGDHPLARGTYTVAWRVVSADSHPVHGAFVFSVRSKSDTSGVISQVLKEDEVPREVSVGFTLTRFLGFALLLACIGGALMLFGVFRGIETPVRPTLHRVLGVLALVLAGVSLVGIVFQGASAGGFGLGDAISWDVFRAVLDTRFGEVWLVRAGLAAGLGLVAFSRVHPSYLLPFAVGLAWTAPASGHANTAGALAFAMDLLHVLAASIWAGGLSFVLLALILAGADRWPLAAAIVPRFSALAVGSVAVLLVGGIVNGYLEVRAWRGLWETNYGRLLLAKAAIVLFLLGLGAYNNRYSVPRLKRQVASVSEQRRFLRAAGAEVALFVAAIGVTAVLVAEPPAKAFVAPSGPVARTAPVGPYELNLVVDPAEKGSNNIHLYLLEKNGQLAKVAEAEVEATLPDPGIGPLQLETHPAGPGHFSRARCVAAARGRLGPRSLGPPRRVRPLARHSLCTDTKGVILNMRRLLLAITGLGALAAVSVASAHIEPSPGSAAAGSFQLVAFQVPHGCDGSPTKSISIQIPAGVIYVKPQVKSGWRIAMKKGKLPVPGTLFGEKVTTGVVSVTWSGGSLPDAYYDTFNLDILVPNKVGKTIYFPTVQRCAKGVTRWIEIQQKGKPEPEHPAPGLKITKSTGGGD